MEFELTTNVDTTGEIIGSSTSVGASFGGGNFASDINVSSSVFGGVEGPAGPANSLSIGTVSDGLVAGATIVGTSPAQILNLILPKGLKGDTGNTPIKGIDYFDGIDGSDGREVELQKSATHVQWRYVGDTTWNNLIALTDITGAPGTDGTEIELQKTATHIQWRYIGGIWTDLVALIDLKGSKGDPGDDGYTPIKNVDYFDGADGAAGLGVPIGGTTGQVLAKNSATDYDTAWVAQTGGGGTSDHASLTNLAYAMSGHTGFQPAGTYLTTETDPVFTAWDKDYADLSNKPTLGTAAAAATTDFAPALGADDNYVTDTEKSNLHAPGSDNQDLTVLLPKAGGTMTGQIVLKTGSTTVAPLKMVAGTNLTTPLAGAFEFDGTNLYFTI